MHFWEVKVLFSLRDILEKDRETPPDVDQHGLQYIQPFSDI